MAIPLTEETFRQTFHPPMRRLGEDESFRPVPLGGYIDQCIVELGLPTTREEIEVHHVYVSGDQRYTHVILFYGESNRYLVVVVAHPQDEIFGHRLLCLDTEYGLAPSP